MSESAKAPKTGAAQANGKDTNTHEARRIGNPPRSILGGVTPAHNMVRYA
jgi:hypothetical protein